MPCSAQVVMEAQRVHATGDADASIYSNARESTQKLRLLPASIHDCTLCIVLPYRIQNAVLLYDLGKWRCFFEQYILCACASTQKLRITKSKNNGFQSAVHFMHSQLRSTSCTGSQVIRRLFLHSNYWQKGKGN
jgi:hypothetical protein